MGKARAGETRLMLTLSYSIGRGKRRYTYYETVLMRLVSFHPVPQVFQLCGIVTLERSLRISRTNIYACRTFKSYASIQPCRTWLFTNEGCTFHMTTILYRMYT